jgi:hypothetical protein
MPGIAPPLRKTSISRLTRRQVFGEDQIAKSRSSPALPDVRPAPQAGCFVSGLLVSSESQIALRYRAFGILAVEPSSVSAERPPSVGRLGVLSSAQAASQPRARAPVASRHAVTA